MHTSRQLPRWRPEVSVLASAALLFGCGARARNQSDELWQSQSATRKNTASSAAKITGPEQHNQRQIAYIAVVFGSDDKINLRAAAIVADAAKKLGLRWYGIRYHDKDGVIFLFETALDAVSAMESVYHEELTMRDGQTRSIYCEYIR